MKIQRFLIFVQDTLLSTPDISIKTMRLIIDKFESCLSERERENEITMLILRVIKEVSLKQISLKEMNEISVSLASVMTRLMALTEANEQLMLQINQLKLRLNTGDDRNLDGGGFKE